MEDPNDPKTWKSTLVLPTLNEIEAVRVIVPMIDRSVVDEILVVDGGSTDGTVEYMREQGLNVLIQEGRGYGAAMQLALERASHEIVVEFPADGSSLIDRIPDVIARMREGYDLVIASRYKQGAYSEDDDLITAFGNRMFTFLVNRLFGSSYTDVLVGFRALRRSVALQLGLREEGLSWPCESSIRFVVHHRKVSEVPATEPPRIGGTRKMIPHKTGMEILKLIVRERIKLSLGR